MDRSTESLAIALHVERVHGTDGPRYIAEQIGRLAMEGDRAGVDRWREIAKALDSLSVVKTPLS